MDIFEKRRPNLFEKAILVVGIAMTILGFFLINKMYMKDAMMTWNLIISSFLWLITILLLIMASASQDIKEEISILIRETKQEITLLREDLRKHGRK